MLFSISRIMKGHSNTYHIMSNNDWSWISWILWYRRSDRNYSHAPCHSVFFQETDVGPIGRYWNKGLKWFIGKNACTASEINRIPEIDKDSEQSWRKLPEVAYAHDILFTFAHVFHMRKRKVQSDNEWTGWLRWMKSSFEQGEIIQIWKNTIQMEKWFDPAFQEFVDKELIPLNNK